MKKHIAEDLPARKFPQAALSAKKEDSKKEDRGGGDSGQKTPEEKVRQAVYDIRYRARRENLSLRQAYTQYLQNSSMSEQEKSMVREKLFGKGGTVNEGILANIDVSDFAASSLANAMYKVFVEKTNELEEVQYNNDYLEELAGSSEKKYKVRVTDKNGTSYVRYATREKVNALRANPNIDSVEMTEYGEPYEGERKSGEQTAKSKAGKDYDGDGKVESGAKEYRGAVHNAIQRKKGLPADGKDTSSVKEEFIGETVRNNTKKKKDTPIDVMRGQNKVQVNPPEAKDKLFAHYEIEIGGGFLTEKAKSKAQQRFMGMVYAAKKGEEAASPEVAKAAASMSKGEAKKFAKTKHKGLPGHKTKKKNVREESECGTSTGSEKEVDPRQKATRKSLIASKFQSMGVKNPIVVMGEEGVEPGLNPAYSSNKVKRDKYETQTRRASAPKGVGVPDKSKGYGGLKD